MSTILYWHSKSSLMASWVASWRTSLSIFLVLPVQGSKHCPNQKRQHMLVADWTRSSIDVPVRRKPSAYTTWSLQRRTSGADLHSYAQSASPHQLLDTATQSAIAHSPFAPVWTWTRSGRSASLFGSPLSGYRASLGCPHGVCSPVRDALVSRRSSAVGNHSTGSSGTGDEAAQPGG